jgi:ATP-dependent RNA helicase DHX8/PRP22
MFQLELERDPLVCNSYSVVMDETHERTIVTDATNEEYVDRVNLKSLNKLPFGNISCSRYQKFSKCFFDCPIFTIPGRTYPVEVLYTKKRETNYLDASLITVMQIHLFEPPGDSILFVTGQHKLDTACEILFENIESRPKVPELIVLPIYSSLPSEVQSRVFDVITLPGARKVDIATNVAKTSLTILASTI